MKWKTKQKERSMVWEKVFVVLPKKTQEGYTVMLQYVWRRWKMHMSSGKYVYVLEHPENK